MLGVNLGISVKHQALEIGFDLVGIAPATPGRDLEFAREWVERGYGGEMRHLANPKRFDPRTLLPSVKSVICVGLVYNTAYPYSTEVKEQAGSRQNAAVVEGEAVSSPKGLAAAPVTPAPSVPGRASPLRGTAERNAPNAWISRYAWGRDYHDVMRVKLERLRAAIEKLAPGAETRIYVDTGPVVERAFARFSGIGWMGKNTCIINDHKGSWFFLGVLLTSLELEPDLPAPDRCGTCTACLEACPTGALIEPYVMDAMRCISYLTIELKGSIPERFREQMSSNIFGCDICQDVCPWNAKSRSQESEVSRQEGSFPPLPTSHQPSAVSGQAAEAEAPEGWKNLDQGVSPGNAGPKKRAAPLSRASREGSGVRATATTTMPEFQPLQLTIKSRALSLFMPSLEDLAVLTEEDFRRVFRHSAIRRAKYRGWLRNLCVAMGNSGNPRFKPKLKELMQHPDFLVREHAEWALERMRILDDA